jgi:hydrogenase nickel incorporation protein HypB
MLNPSGSCRRFSNRRYQLVFHVPLVQVNTDPGFGGECHLDANMVRLGLSGLPLPEIDALVIENVGNLMCPAEFKVG